MKRTKQTKGLKKLVRVNTMPDTWIEIDPTIPDDVALAKYQERLRLNAPRAWKQKREDHYLLNN